MRSRSEYPFLFDFHPMIARGVTFPENPLGFIVRIITFVVRMTACCMGGFEHMPSVAFGVSSVMTKKSAKFVPKHMEISQHADMTGIISIHPKRANGRNQLSLIAILGIC